jgi:hypothetical protein
MLRHDIRYIKEIFRDQISGSGRAGIPYLSGSNKGRPDVSGFAGIIVRDIFIGSVEITLQPMLRM